MPSGMRFAPRFVVMWLMLLLVPLLQADGPGDGNDEIFDGEDIGSGWMQYWSAEYGRPYYYHEEDEVTTWTKPDLEYTEAIRDEGEANGSEEIESIMKESADNEDDDDVASSAFGHETCDEGTCVENGQGDKEEDEESDKEEKEQKAPNEKHKRKKEKVNDESKLSSALVTNNCILIKLHEPSDNFRTGKTFAIDVNTVDDHGPATNPTNPSGCTLRAAIVLANTLSRRFVCQIRLMAGLFKMQRPLPAIRGTTVLMGAAAPYWKKMIAYFFDDEKSPKNGPHVTIHSTLDGQNQFGLIQTSSKSTVFVQNVRFQNGWADAGGAFHARGNIDVRNCHFIKNRAHYGGAIHAEKKVDVYHTNFEFNMATNGGGAAYVSGLTNIAQCNFHANSDNSHNLFFRGKRIIQAPHKLGRGMSYGPGSGKSADGAVYSGPKLCSKKRYRCLPQWSPSSELRSALPLTKLQEHEVIAADMAHQRRLPGGAGAGGMSGMGKSDCASDSGAGPCDMPGMGKPSFSRMDSHTVRFCCPRGKETVIAVGSVVTTCHCEEQPQPLAELASP